MEILRIRNPIDGVDSFDKIKIYSSTSKGGTYALLATVDISLSNAALGYAGYTSYQDNAGSENTWYKFTYFNSGTSSETSKSEAFHGGNDQLDTMIRIRVKDTNENKYNFTDDEISQAKALAIESLYPATWIDTSYDITITDLNKKEIVLPVYISRPDKLLVYDANGDYMGEYTRYYRTGRSIRSFDEFPVGDTIKIVYTKRYQYHAECPEYLDSYLLDIAEIELMKVLELDRSRYYQYTSSVRPEGGNMPSLGKIIERLEVTANRKINPYRRVREVGEINLVG